MKKNLSTKGQKEIKSLIKEKLINLQENQSELSCHAIYNIRQDIYNLCLLIGKNYGYNILSKIDKIAIAKLKKEKDEKCLGTVGKLIEHLSKYDKNIPIYVEKYVDCWDGEGTNMSYMDEKRIEEICDLESRLVLKLE